MRTGIIICGLNGVGKSTLGKALAEKLDFYFIDNEDLFFPKDNPDYLFASPRTRIEAEKLLFDEVKAHENFVLSAEKILFRYINMRCWLKFLKKSGYSG